MQHTNSTQHTTLLPTKESALTVVALPIDEPKFFQRFHNVGRSQAGCTHNRPNRYVRLHWCNMMNGVVCDVISTVAEVNGRALAFSVAT
jgi:hypothetical protein